MLQGLAPWLTGEDRNLGAMVRTVKAHGSNA
jgi:hypothetical protein